MKTIKFSIEGTTPLMINDDKAANPLNEFAKQIKVYSQKRKKTEDDILAMFKLQFCAAWYYDSKMGYFLKPTCFEKSLECAAKMKKLGTKFVQGVHVFTTPLLKFKDCDKTPDFLFDNLQEYVDIRNGVLNGKARITVCRPIINNWSTTVEICYDESLVNEGDIIEAMNNAGAYFGVGTYRKLFGRFAAKMIK